MCPIQPISLRTNHTNTRTGFSNEGAQTLAVACVLLSCAQDRVLLRLGICVGSVWAYVCGPQYGAPSHLPVHYYRAAVGLGSCPREPPVPALLRGPRARASHCTL